MHFDIPPHLCPGQLVWLPRVSSVIRVANRDAQWVEAQTILFTRVIADSAAWRIEVCFFPGSDWRSAGDVYATEAEARAVLAQHEQRAGAVAPP